MTRHFAWAARAMRHTRIVQSGSPPLYRLVVIAVIISGVCQGFDREATQSVAAQTPTWFDFVFIGSTLLGGVLTLTGLYMIDESRFDASRLGDSLHVERFGLSIIMAVIAVNIVAVMFYYGKPPTSMGSWLQIMFWLWGWTRLNEIRRALRGLKQ